MARQNRFKSFEELNSVVLDIAFEEFAVAGIDERRRILAAFDLIYQGYYKGTYSKTSNKVIISDKRNPFSGEILRVKLVGGILSIPDKAKVIVKLTAFKDNGKLTPNNIFAGQFIRFADKQNNNNDFDGIPLYSKEEAEKERELLKKQDRARFSRLKDKREKAQLEEAKLRKQEIGAILEERKIFNLVHFSRIENIDSIIEFGLLPITQLEKNELQFIKNDEGRYDNKDNCISVTIEYPNYWVLKEFRERYPYSKWAILVLDSSLLLEHNCYFAEHNAASIGISKSLNNKVTSHDFLKMFDPVVKVQKTTGIDTYNRINLNNQFSYLPTSEQAEILVEGTIDTKYIKGVWFMDSEDAEIYRRKLESKRKIVKVNSSIFTTSRENYKGFRCR